MPQISVIVPVYNVEDHLSKCINSLLKQSYSDFELILVDDGSTDQSGAICEEFSRIDKRVRVIHKANSGVSSARNIGIDKAVGNYITFIDADDFVEEDYLRELLDYEFDLVICDAWYTNPDGSTQKRILDLIDGIDMVSDKNILCWYEKGIMYSVWGRLFSLTLIRNNQIFFDENTTRGEDTIFMFNYVDKCNNIKFISEPMYYYVQYGKEGSSSKKFNFKNVVALNYLDSFIANWLENHNLQSKKFESVDYWTKREQLEYFWRVYNDVNMSSKEKYRWYKLFFSLPNFTNNLDGLFENENARFRKVVNIKSPLLLLIFQRIVDFKNR